MRVAGIGHFASGSSFDWSNKKNWLRSAHNTKWCLIGCTFGDWCTIFVLQLVGVDWSTLTIFALSTVNGLITSVILETVILIRGGMDTRTALRTALGMSFISMVAMETAMNLTDYLLAGGARLTWWVLPFSLSLGFLTPWPYNYWRLERYGRSCH